MTSIRVCDLLDLMFEDEKVSIFSVHLKHQSTGIFTPSIRSEISDDILSAPVIHFWRSEFDQIMIAIE